MPDCAKLLTLLNELSDSTVSLSSDFKTYANGGTDSDVKKRVALAEGLYEQILEIIIQPYSSEYIASQLPTKEEIIKNNYDLVTVALSMVGVGTPESMELRYWLKEQGVEAEYMLQGLTGVDTPEAIQMRREYLGEDRDLGLYWRIMDSLVGTQSPASFDLRHEILKKEYHHTITNFFNSLTGVASRSAMQARWNLLEDYPHSIAPSLAGIDTEESMRMRRKLVELGADEIFIIDSLTGVGTREAMDMRWKIITTTDDSNILGRVAKSLAGIGNAESIEMRMWLIENKSYHVSFNSIATGLMGVGNDDSMVIRDILCDNEYMKIAGAKHRASLRGAQSPEAIRRRSEFVKELGATFFDEWSFDDFSSIPIDIPNVLRSTSRNIDNYLDS